MSKPGKRRSPIRWLVLLILLMAGTITVVCYPREPLLLERSVKVANTSDWDFRWTRYYWINNHEVLFFRFEYPQDPVENGWHFFKHNIVTGKDTYLSDLSHAADNSFGKHSYLAISPDGKQVFWTDEEGYLFFSCTLEGKHKHPFDRGRWSQVAWMRDSSHLIEYVINQRGDHFAYGLIHDLKQSATPERLTVPLNLPPEEVSVSTSSDLLSVTWKDKGEGNDVTDYADVYVSRVGKETQPARQYHIRLPFKAEIWDEEFSPQGDRILWPLVQESTVPPLLAWLHRTISAFNPEPKPKMSLWVSRLDGSQMQEIGYVPLKSDKEYSGVLLHNMPDHIYWLPDGKQISFCYKNALYTVPVNEKDRQK